MTGAEEIWHLGTGGKQWLGGRTPFNVRMPSIVFSAAKKA